MNCLMAGMVPVMILAMKSIPASRNPSEPAFWFVMSMALLVGLITAYPMNWWLVSRSMKHGMMTVRPSHEPMTGEAKESMHDNHTPSDRTGGAQRGTMVPIAGAVKPVSVSALARMTALSFLVLGAGLSVAVIFAGI